MRFLLDTHVVLWMLSSSGRLSGLAREILTDAGNELFFSMAGYWEIGIKVSIGKLELVPEWQDIIPREMTSNGVSWLPIRASHVHEVTSLPWHHRDPFDRLLIAQARVEGLSVISGDTQYDSYDVTRVW